MSTNLAYPLAAPGRREREFEERPSRVRIVTTRAQRRARPRATYALVAIVVVFAIFMAQLLLTIALSSGAYRIAGLQSTQRSLGQVQSSLEEKLHTLGSAQNLAANAQALGMVTASTPAYLQLSNGAVSGVPTPAAAGAPPTVQNGSTDSVPNSLLTDIPVISSSMAGHGASNAGDSAAGSTQSTGDAGTPGTGTSLISNGSTSSGATSGGSSDPNALPSPNTH